MFGGSKNMVIHTTTNSNGQKSKQSSFVLRTND